MSKRTSATRHSPHTRRKAKFREYLAGRMALDLATAERHNACDFGRWLEGEGRRVLPPAEHATLHAAHAALLKAVGGA